MVNIPREGFVLLLKLGRAILKSEDSTEVRVETTTPEITRIYNTEPEPMKDYYWETDKKTFFDPYSHNAGLDQIPDTTDEPVKESHFDLNKINLGYLDKSAYLDINGKVLNMIILFVFVFK